MEVGIVGLGSVTEMVADSTPQSRGASTPRSPTRSKRSTTNLSNLRLAPLSTKFAEPPQKSGTAKSPFEESPEITFSRHHPSYLQGKSAPTTPGILSRSSSRRRLDGGLSRRGSLYDDDVPYQYASVARDQSGGLRVDVGSGQIPKAKSEAALLVHHRLSGEGVPLKKKKHHVHSRTGTISPVARRKPKDTEDDWLTRTRASTNALLQEAKGQSWLASRDSSTSLAHLDSDDDDEGYEEMAAMSASNANLQPLDSTSSAVAPRVKSPMWGSRYGSRSASRRTSRRGSRTDFHTPLAWPSGHDGSADYFDEDALAVPTEPDFVDPDEGDGADESEVAKLTDERSFGLGGIVDRLMGFNLFNVEEREETTDDEADKGNDTEHEAKGRAATEAKRKLEEKERLTSPPAPTADAEQGDGGWQDAAWLLSVASKAMF